MKKRLKVILFLLLGILLIIQLPFFRPAPNVSTEQPMDDIAMKYDVPMHILMDLNDGCYDCHSNYTSYVKIKEGAEGADSLWYKNIQPVSWWMSLHIQRAKKEVNFSEFANLSPEEAIEAFKKIEEVMEDRSMPLKSYLWQHDEAKLSEEQYQDLAQWARDMQQEIREGQNDS